MPKRASPDDQDSLRKKSRQDIGDAGGEVVPNDNEIEELMAQQASEERVQIHEKKFPFYKLPAELKDEVAINALSEYLPSNEIRAQMKGRSDRQVQFIQGGKALEIGYEDAIELLKDQEERESASDLEGPSIYDEVESDGGYDVEQELSWEASAARQDAENERNQILINQAAKATYKDLLVKVSWESAAHDQRLDKERLESLSADHDPGITSDDEIEFAAAHGETSASTRRGGGLDHRSRERSSTRGW